MNLFEDLYGTCLAALTKINSMEIIDNKLIGELLAKAGSSARLGGGGICLIRILGRMRIL